MKLNNILPYIIAFIVGLLLSIIFSCAKSNRTINNNNIHYCINHYTDTINGHIILSTVCDYDNNISISTLDITNNDTISIR